MQTNNKPPKCYKATDGVIYRCIGIGYSMDSGIAIAVLRRISDGTIWTINKEVLHRSRLIDGVPTYDYTELRVGDDEYPYNNRWTNQAQYNAYGQEAYNPVPVEQPYHGAAPDLRNANTRAGFKNPNKRYD